MCTGVHVFSGREIVRAGIEAIVAGRPNLRFAGSHDVADLSRLPAGQPGSVVIVDGYSLERGRDGIEQVLRAVTRSREVLLLVDRSGHRPLRYLRAGVRGLIADGSLTGDLVAAITHLSGGRAYISAGLLDELVDSLRAGVVTEDVQPRLAVLTERERAVLDLVLSGLSNAEITRVLQVTESTVKFHISNIFRKLMVRSRSQLMAYVGVRPGT